MATLGRCGNALTVSSDDEEDIPRAAPVDGPIWDSIIGW